MTTNLFHTNHRHNKCLKRIFWDGYFTGVSFFPFKPSDHHKCNKNHAIMLMKQGYLRDREMFELDLINLRKDFEAAQGKLLELENEPD